MLIAAIALIAVLFVAEFLRRWLERFALARAWASQDLALLAIAKSAAGVEMAKAKLLKNIQVNEISLVLAGANGAEFIAKTADTRLLVQIGKTDAVKKTVSGVVYEPDKKDTQGEWATPDEVEKAAWGALKNHAVVKTQHDQPAGAFLAESYIAKKGDPDGYAPGAWIAVVKIEDPALWGQVEKGDFKAFSMGGQAQKVEQDPPDAAMLAKVNAILKDATPAQRQAIAKDISADSMVYASDLKSAVALLGAVSAAVANLQATVDGVQKNLATTQALAKSAVEQTVKVAELQVLVEKISKFTEGRLTEQHPGTPVAIVKTDPARY